MPTKYPGRFFCRAHSNASGKLGLLPPPLWGRVGEGGDAVMHRRCLTQSPPPLTPPHKGEGNAASLRRGEHTECGAKCVANPTAARAFLWGRTNGAATHVEGALAACGGAGGVRGLERRRPPPPSRLLRRAHPIELRRLAARPRGPRSTTRSRTGSAARPRTGSPASSRPGSAARPRPRFGAGARPSARRRPRAR
jgi:hypothetical protein